MAASLVDAWQASAFGDTEYAKSRAYTDVLDVLVNAERY